MCVYIESYEAVLVSETRNLASIRGRVGQMIAASRLEPLHRTTINGLVVKASLRDKRQLQIKQEERSLLHTRAYLYIY